MKHQTKSTYNTLVHENAQRLLGEMLDQLYDVNANLGIVQYHALFHEHKEYEAATTHAETHLLNLITAVENVRNVENRLAQ
ncbi:hypothetical protein [uncultured Actinomyces sp.]|uniref:hypothetical protein n=1 Tax=uncultured Actinomyces sp. TaxID=249061 RepID=UPI0026338C59|nr:hypothetical protein [uncultured Actinomyces sp.]MDK8534458.1 hypothetical protein [Gleimia europaea]